MSDEWTLEEMEADIAKYGGGGIIGEHAERLLAEVKRLRRVTTALEFVGNDELVNELMSRESFKGIVLYGKGEYDNLAPGDGGMKVRASKGMQVKTLLDYMRGALEAFRKMFPAAVEQMFGPKPEDY